MAEEKKPNAFVRMGKEFQTFISRGNVLDMAVGVIIGGAFTAIVNSLVNDILMPVISLILAGINVQAWKVSILFPWLKDTNIPPVELLFGNFIQAIITFFLTALCVFMIVKIMNTIKDRAEKLKKKNEEEAPAEPPKPDPQLVLLTEIRDLLKAQNEIVENYSDEVLEEE